MTTLPKLLTATPRQYHLFKPGDGFQCICGRKFTVSSLNTHMCLPSSGEAATSPPAQAKKLPIELEEEVGATKQGDEDNNAEVEEGVTHYVDLFPNVDTAAPSPIKQRSVEEWEAWWLDGKGTRKRRITEVNEGAMKEIAYLKGAHAKARAQWDREREELLANLKKEKSKSIPRQLVKVWPVRCTPTNSKRLVSSM